MTWFGDLEERGRESIRGFFYKVDFDNHTPLQGTCRHIIKVSKYPHDFLLICPYIIP